MGIPGLVDLPAGGPAGVDFSRRALKTSFPDAA